MRKFAATVLALALATTHGLLDEGGPIVQDAPRGLRGDAQADSSLARAAVGRKLEFGYTDDVSEPTPTPTVAPTSSEPTPAPTKAPTVKPTAEPTSEPTAKSTGEPTSEPTAAPTAQPTGKPTPAPIADETEGPTAAPTPAPTQVPVHKSHRRRLAAFDSLIEFPTGRCRRRSRRLGRRLR